MKIADEFCHDKRRFCYDRVWQGYNISQLKQVFICCEKVFNIRLAQEKFLSQQRKLYHDIKFRVHNKGQQDFVVTKKFSGAINKHEVEVNFVATKKSLSRKEVENQYKKNVATMRFYVAT